MLGAGVSIGVCGMRKPPGGKWAFIMSVEVLIEGAVVKLCKWSWDMRLAVVVIWPPADIAQLSSILIIVLLSVDGIRFRDGTLLTIIIDEESLLAPVAVDWRPAPVGLYRLFMSFDGRATNLVLVCVCCVGGGEIRRGCHLFPFQRYNVSYQ